eukprot:15133077-Alexandrium_andersonii.AAC.1
MRQGQSGGGSWWRCALCDFTVPRFLADDVNAARRASKSRQRHLRSTHGIAAPERVASDPAGTARRSHMADSRWREQLAMYTQH